MTTPLRVAVLGTGSAGARHLRVLQQMPGIEPIAVPLRPSRLAELARAGYATAPDVPAAAALGARLGIVATDSGRHHEDVQAAAEQGLDVLVEKPLAVDAGSAAVLCRRMQELGRKLFVGCVLRFSEPLNAFRDRLGRIGDVHSVRIESQSYLPDWRPARRYEESYSARADEGGVLRDLIHEIDYAGWLFGWPTALHGQVRNLGRLGIKADEAADLAWETATGCAVTVRLDYLTRPPRRRMLACGERGTLEYDGISGTVTLALDGAPERIESSQTRDEVFRAQDHAFIAARTGAADPRLATGADGLHALAVCDAARRSSQSGREEPVRDAPGAPASRGPA